MRDAAQTSHARVSLALVVSLIALAWLALLVWSTSPWQRWLAHGAWGDLAWLAALCRSVPAGETVVPAASSSSCEFRFVPAAGERQLSDSGHAEW